VAHAELQFDPLTLPLAGVHSIAASAGTGKTYTITTLYVRYLLEANCRIDDILVTTFTEAATAELKERLRSRVHEALDLARLCDTVAQAEALVAAQRADETILRLLDQAGAWRVDTRQIVQDRLTAALLNFDHAPIFTIHGFCNRVLQELMFETSSRFDLELVTSQETLVDDAVADFAARQWATDDSVAARWVALDEGLWQLMREIAAKALDNPGFPICPDDGELQQLFATTLLDDFDNQSRALAAAWGTHREEVCQMLFTARDNGWLNGNTHGRANQLEESIAFIDALSCDPSPDVFTFKSGHLEASQRRLAQSELERGTKKDHKANTPRHSVFKLVEELVRLVLHITDHQAQIRARVLSRLARTVRNQVARRKQQLGIMSFSDLLHHVDHALVGPQGQSLLARLRERYTVAMVDEFQDTDPVQHRIFDRIFQQPAEDTESAVRSFVMIGDPKQSIYRFRGADIHSYLQATSDTPPEHRHTLGVNWRSDRPLVAGVQAVFGCRPRPFIYDNIPLPDVQAHHGGRFPDNAALEICLIPRQEDAGPDRAQNRDAALQHVGRRVAAEIVAQLNAGPTIVLSEGQSRSLVPGDIAVLCRTGKQLRLIQAELAARNVPAVLQTDESVFDTAEATATAHVLRALINPGDLRLQSNALVMPLFGLTAEQMETLGHDEQQLSDWGERFEDWHELWIARGFIAAWRRLIEDMKVVARLARQIGGERQVTNYLHLGELLHRQAVSANAGPDQLLRWLEGLIADPQRRADDEAQLRLETDAAAVQLCTIHKSKGLEYPVVYCPTLWHTYGGARPLHVIARLDEDNRPLEVAEIDVGSERLAERLDQDAREAMAEDRRLLYVALTRAKHQCRIFCTAVNGAADSALGQLMFDGLTKEASDAELDKLLRAWVDALPAARIAYRGLDDASQFQDPGRYAPPPSPAAVLACRPSVRPALPRLVRSSFSALARSVDQADDLEIPDRDVSALQDGSAPGDAVADEHRVPLADMPGGARVGDLVHRVFEDVIRDDRRRACDAQLARDLVTEHLQADIARYDLDPAWMDPLAGVLTKCLTGIIAEVNPTCCLFDLPRADVACEMHFLLRVADYDRSMDPRSLGSALARIGV